MKDFFQSGKGRLFIANLISILVTGILYYIFLPPLNPEAQSFYLFLLAVLGVFVLNNFLSTMHMQVSRQNSTIRNSARLAIIVALLIVLALIIGGISSAKLFRAKSYAGIITVTETEFETDMEETTSITNIALMDSESARTIGSRALGSLSEVVSQYTLNEKYSQINYQGAPKKLSNLEYDGFFKWLNNRKNGIPGFVMVDPVENSAGYVKLDTPIRYADSGYFGDDLARKLRFSYPTKIFGSVFFEIDEDGNPYYIVSCLSSGVGLFGAKDVKEVILFDPCDGSSVIYSVEETPSWVDLVYDGELAMQKYNWYGNLSGGFWNSLIGNKNCKVTTDDYGYITIGDDVWYFTGVTSVTSDESNIGFIISNARTGEYRFYPVVGAEEYSAMSAAEGEVQEKGYTASFPSLVNISGQATYIMVLKDSGGLVKLYALVNVENYGIVATGSTQSEVISAYRKLLKANGEKVKSDTAEPKTILVDEVRIVSLDGVPTVYIMAVDGNVYKGLLTNDESLILIREDDVLTVLAEETDISGLYEIESWEKQ